MIGLPDPLPPPPGVAPGSGSTEPGRLVTTWRLVQKLDADAWRALGDGPPLRFARWLAALLTVILYLPHGTGTAHYVYVGAIVVTVLLPDAQSVGFAGIKFEMRRTADEVARIGQQIQHVSTIVQTRQQTNVYLLTMQGTRVAGNLAAATAEAEQAPDVPAQAVAVFADPEPGTGQA
jgi:hypothetical protein